MQRKNMYIAAALAVVVVAYFVITGTFGLPSPMTGPQDTSAPTTDATQVDAGIAAKATAFLNEVRDAGKVDDLRILDVAAGEGDAVAAVGDTVYVQYTGLLTDGTIFDSSRQPGREPFFFTLGENRVIQGWEQGVLGMKAGSKRLLAIPASLGYGDRGQGPIPPGATLIFEVEVLDIVKAQ